MSRPQFDLMVDIETLSTRPTAAVVAIGAVKFDPLGLRLKANPMPELFITISVPQARMLGHVDPQTVEWWATQPQMLRQLIMSGSITPDKALAELFVFAKGCNKVWAKSPTFDCVILRHLATQLGMTWPFSHRDEHDVRTMEHAGWRFGLDMNDPKYLDAKPIDSYSKHHPLGDCAHQILMVQIVSAELARRRHRSWRKLFRG